MRTNKDLENDVRQVVIIGLRQLKFRILAHYKDLWLINFTHLRNNH